jgi:hypothetical protein
MPKMSDEERQILEQHMDEAPPLMVPVSDNQALHLFVVHALRDMSSTARANGATLREMQGDVRSMSERMIRVEERVDKIKDLDQDVVKLREEDLAAVKKELQELKDEKQRRVGMQWLVEWVGKFFPWLAAVAAGVWAMKVTPD